MAKEYVFLKIDLKLESKFFVLMLMYGGLPITMSKPFLLSGRYSESFCARYLYKVHLWTFSFLAILVFE